MKTLLAFVALFFALNAQAVLPLPLEKAGIALSSFTGSNEYRLGDEWGKKPVNAADLDKAPASFRRAALATARVGGGTSFYLGKFNGRLVMATNHHVMPDASGCSFSRVRFPLLNVVASCESFLGSWDEIDLTLFTIRAANAADEAKLQGVAGNFRFNDDIQKGEKLLTAGFGVAENPTGVLMLNQDSDCYVFSPNAEYRLMADPDQLNPGTYRAWSFAIGCDVSHGDSGSAIVDRANGNVVGIIWTGRIPKSAAAQTTRYLNDIFQKQDAAIWEELSYAVPAKKMGEVLTRVTESNELAPDARATVKAVLGL